MTAFLAAVGAVLSALFLVSPPSRESVGADS